MAERVQEPKEVRDVHSLALVEVSIALVAHPVHVVIRLAACSDVIGSDTSWVRDGPAVVAGIAYPIVICISLSRVCKAGTVTRGASDAVAIWIGCVPSPVESGVAYRAAG